MSTDNIFTFTRSAYWGTGHYLVAYPEGSGRVSKNNDGTWSAFDWAGTPIWGIAPRPALAAGLTSRRDAAIVLRTVSQVSDALNRETDELVKQMENRSCGHI